MNFHTQFYHNVWNQIVETDKKKSKSHHKLPPKTFKHLPIKQLTQVHTNYQQMIPFLDLSGQDHKVSTYIGLMCGAILTPHP